MLQLLGLQNGGENETFWHCYFIYIIHYRLSHKRGKNIPCHVPYGTPTEDSFHKHGKVIEVDCDKYDK